MDLQLGVGSGVHSKSLLDPNISISGRGWEHHCFQDRLLSDVVNFIFISSSGRKSSYSFSSLIITSITRYESNIELVLKQIAYLMRTRCLPQGVSRMAEEPCTLSGLLAGPPPLC